MVQYLSGGCELDLMVAVDCTAENGYWREEESLHFSSKSWLNDYQAVLFRIGSIFDAYEGSDFHMMGYGARWHGSPAPFFQIGERVQNADDLVRAYDRTFSEEVAKEKALVMQTTAELKHVIQAAMFRAVNANKNGRQCYSTLVILTTGVISDLQESIDAVCAAAEDAPLSIILIGIGKGDFEHVHKLVAGESANGVPIARDIMQFVSMSDFNGNARECVAEAFQNIQEQCVQHFTGSGVQPFPPKPVPDFTNEQIFGKAKKTSSKAIATTKSRKRATKATC
jgi:Copine